MPGPARAVEFRRRIGWSCRDTSHSRHCHGTAAPLRAVPAAGVRAHRDTGTPSACRTAAAPVSGEGRSPGHGTRSTVARRWRLHRLEGWARLPRSSRTTLSARQLSRPALGKWHGPATGPRHLPRIGRPSLPRSFHGQGTAIPLHQQQHELAASSLNVPGLQHHGNDEARHRNHVLTAGYPSSQRGQAGTAAESALKAAVDVNL